MLNAAFVSALQGGKAAGNSVSCIVHMASWGMSGAEMADFDATVEAVNVGVRTFAHRFSEQEEQLQFRFGSCFTSGAISRSSLTVYCNLRKPLHPAFGLRRAA